MFQAASTTTTPPTRAGVWEKLDQAGTGMGELSLEMHLEMLKFLSHPKGV